MRTFPKILVASLLLALAAPALAQEGGEATTFDALDLSGGDEGGAAAADDPADVPLVGLTAPDTPAAEAAPAAEAPPAPPAEAPGPRGTFRDGLFLGVKVGAGFGQLMSPFGTAFLPELELGWAPSPAFVLFFAGQYAAPVAEGTTAPDPRLPGSGELHYTITQNQLILTLGLSYRLDVSSDLVRPYLSAGGRSYLMRSDVVADGGGQDFGPNAETSTSWGAFGALGVELALGPGDLTAEVQLGWAPLETTILRETSTGALNGVVGYRLYLF